MHFSAIMLFSSVYLCIHHRCDMCVGVGSNRCGVCWMCVVKHPLCAPATISCGPSNIYLFVHICICEKNSFSKTNHFVDQPPFISVLLLCGTLFALVDFRGYHVHRLVAMGSLLVSSVKSA